MNDQKENLKILIVEDEKKLNEMIRDYLASLGYGTVSAFSGNDALKLVKDEQPDLVILDLMLPGIDGLDAARSIRRFSSVPIIMLTARAEEADKLIGLEIGADDYMTKPFSLRELVARIRAVLRRSGGAVPTGDDEVIRCGLITLDPVRMVVSREGEKLSLTSVQFSLLQKMMRQPGRVFTRMDLLESLQDVSFEGYERTIDVHIKNIRKVLEPDPAHPRYILTVWGVGYKFNDEECR